MLLFNVKSHLDVTALQIGIFVLASLTTTTCNIGQFMDTSYFKGHRITGHQSHREIWNDFNSLTQQTLIECLYWARQRSKHWGESCEEKGLPVLSKPAFQWGRGRTGSLLTNRGWDHLTSLCILWRKWERLGGQRAEGKSSLFQLLFNIRISTITLLKGRDHFVLMCIPSTPETFP